MLKALKRARDNFFGYGDASVAIPVFDGSLKANNLLETAEVLFEREGLEDLIVGDDGQVYRRLRAGDPPASTPTGRQAPLVWLTKPSRHWPPMTEASPLRRPTAWCSRAEPPTASAWTRWTAKR